MEIRYLRRGKHIRTFKCSESTFNIPSILISIMESKQCCGICSSEFKEPPDKSSKLTCSGPCRKSFHALCADLDMTLVNACTSEGGLFWFCRNCRLDYDEEARQRRSVLQATVQRMCGELRKLVERVSSIDVNVKQSSEEAIPAVKRRIAAESNDSKRHRGEVVSEGSVYEESTGEHRTSNRVGSCTEVPRKTDHALSPKIWANVIKSFNFRDLCNARLVNSQWKENVDGYNMSKFILKYPSCMLQDIEQDFIPLLPVSTIIFESNEILAVGSWWSPSITEKLVNLELKKCHISLKNLLIMLQNTPNIVSLSLNGGSTLIYDETDSEISEPRLEKMSNLTLNSVQQDKVLEMFSRMCPQLKYFALLSDYHECHRGVLEMINVVPSLEEISLVSSSNDLSHLAGVNHQFKRVSITITTFHGEELKENLTKFSEKQSFLESLEVRGKINIDVLQLVFQNLPKLKRLSIKLLIDGIIEEGHQDDVTNLEYIRNLTELEFFEFGGSFFLHSNPPQLAFFGARNPKLRELVLCLPVTSATQLQEYIADGINLRSITIGGCHFNSWSNLFAALQSNGLRRLKLESVYVGINDSFRLCEYMDGLQYLKLSRCEMEKQFLSRLLDMCPRLEELHLTEMENVRDAVVLGSFQKMKQLRKLTIIKCPITDHSARYIAEHGLNLEQLRIESCEKLTNKGIAQLNDSKIPVVEIKQEQEQNHHLNWLLLRG